MFDISDLVNGVIVMKACETQRLATGTLVARSEFARVAAAHAARHPGAAAFLCASLHPKCAELFAADTPVWQVQRTVVSPEGIAHAVFVQQVAHWQHRLVVQLVEDEAAEFASRLAAAPPRVYLAGADRGRGVVVQCASAWTAPQAVRLRPGPREVREWELSNDALATVAQLLRPEGVDSCNLTRTRDVCVSLVRSARLRALLAGVLNERVGSRVWR